ELELEPQATAKSERSEKANVEVFIGLVRRTPLTSHDSPQPVAPRGVIQSGDDQRRDPSVARSGRGSTPETPRSRPTCRRSRSGGADADHERLGRVRE